MLSRQLGAKKKVEWCVSAPRIVVDGKKKGKKGVLGKERFGQLRAVPENEQELVFRSLSLARHEIS